MDLWLWWVGTKATVSILLSIFGGIVFIGGTLVLAAWGLFKWLGEKWIDLKFEKRMEEFRTEQQRELERLRHKINAVFDRTTRLHEKEFGHLPDVWAKLIDAYESSAAFLVPLKRYPDIRRMDDNELEIFLKETDLSEGDKHELRVAIQKQPLLERIYEYNKYYRNIEAMNEFSSSFRKNSIFIKPELKSNIELLFRLMKSAVNEQHFALDANLMPAPRDEAKKFEAEGRSLLEKIEKEIQARLWDSTTTEV